MRVFIVALCGIAVTAMLMFAGEKAPASPPMGLKIAVAQQPMSGLIYIAQEEGFFKAEGLEVTLIPYVHGKRALQDLVEGKADIATAAELPFISALASGRRLTTIGAVGAADRQNLIIARNDRGIERPRDLVGKRIGVIEGTSSEIFLDAFLVTHLISSDSVVRVPIKPEEIEQNMLAGTLDAVSIWALPGQSLAAKLTKSKAFTEEGLYIPNWFLLIPESARSKNHQAHVKLLRALLRAEEFEAEQPERARGHVARHLKVEPELLVQGWEGYYFNVGLHQYLVTNLETHARFLQPESGRQIDFVAAMAFAALAEVDPDRVTVIH